MSVKSSQLEPPPSPTIETATTPNKKDIAANEADALRVPSTPKRRRDTSPESHTSSTPPETPDSVTRELASRRVGDRSLTPYPSSPFSPRVTVGRRSLTPSPSRRRQSGSASLSSSPDKENEPLVRSAAPSPSPKKKGKREIKGRGVPLSRTSSASSSASSDFAFTFCVPVNSAPRSRHDREPETTGVDASDLERRLAQVEQKCKELTELPLADITEAFKEPGGKDIFDGLDFSDVLAPLEARRD